MTRGGAVNPRTPNSRTGDTSATPPWSPASTPHSVTHTTTTVTPKTNSIVASFLSGVRKPDESGGGTSTDQPDSTPVTMPASTPPMVARTPPAMGTPVESSLIATTPPVDSPTKKESVKTGIQIIDYIKLDEHGEPLKEQERVSYQNMIVRYGDWGNVRGQVLAYYILILILYIYRGHSKEISAMTEIARVQDGRHIHCCCNASKEQLRLSHLRDEFKMNNTTTIIINLLLILIGGLSPLFIGRRKVLYGYMAAAIPASIVLMFDHTSAIQQISHAILFLCSLMTLLVIISNMVEILPYEMRYLAVYSYIFATSVTSGAATIHFRFGFKTLNMGLIFVFANVLGIVILRFFIKDSICHLNILNEIHAIEETLQKQERRLHEKKMEHGIKFHEAAAKKIFEDVAYLDQDELKLSDFFNRLYKSFAMIDIVLAFFQSVSAALHVYEYTRFTNERFYEASELTMDRMLGMALAGVLMHFLRKSHRNRVICCLFAAALLNSIVRHIVVDYDEKNHCASIHVIENKYMWLSLFLSTLATALNHCTEMTIVLHFLETTPSILRPSCVLLIHVPMTLINEYQTTLFSDRVLADLTVLAPVYAYHVVIIILTMCRFRSRLPFNLYLFDLMPPSDSEADRSDEKIRPMMEETAQPANLSDNKEKQGIKDQKPEEKEKTIEDKNGKKKQKKPKRTKASVKQ